MSPDEEEGGPDPFADLLFTMVATVLPVILVLLPALHAAARAPRTPPEIQLDGTRADPLVAARDGARAPTLPGGLVALAAIPDDLGLRSFLADLRASGRPLLLIVEPDGLESAFVLEPVVALHGPDAIVQVRAATACGPKPDGASSPCPGR